MVALISQTPRLSTAEQQQVVWEMEHRIKNHLQLLSSYVRLSAARPGMTLQAFSAELAEKLTAIASVHEALQTAGDGDAAAEAAAFLVSVCRSFTPSMHAIRIDCPADVMLAPEQLAPVGMIVSEAVSNAFKHAFASKDGPGVVLVQLRTGLGEQELIVRDNGCGLIARPGSGSGLPLIAGFAKKLGGMLRVRDGAGEGAEIIVTFPHG